MSSKKQSNAVELDDTERNQITACIVNTIKSVKPEETIPVIRSLMPLVDKLERKTE